MTDALDAILPGVLNTLLLTALSFLAGAVLALPIVALRSSRGLLVRGIARLFVDLLRSVPPITWLFLIFFGLPQVGVTLDAFPAALIGLSVIASAFLSETYRAGMLAVDRGQVEAARSLGLGSLDVGVRIIAPQAIRVVIPTSATYAIGLLKDTSVASTIGVAEIAMKASGYAQQNGQALRILTLAGVIYLVLSLPLAIVSRGVDRRLRLKFAVV